MAAEAAIAIMAKIHTSVDAAGPPSVLNRMASIPVATATLPPATSRSILFTLIRIRPPLDWLRATLANHEGPMAS